MEEVCCVAEEVHGGVVLLTRCTTSSKVAVFDDGGLVSPQVSRKRKKGISEMDA